MEVEHRDKDLSRLETDPDFTNGYDRGRVRGFRKVMAKIRAAVNERDLYALRGLNFEPLLGDRAGQHSLRINLQWRLIVEIIPSTPKNIVSVVEIADYH